MPKSPPTLETPVADLPGIGKAYAEKLARLGVETTTDLLHYFPRRYDDLSKVWRIDDLAQFGQVPAGERITVKAEVQSVDSRRLRGRKTITKALIGNTRGAIEAVWFNQPYVANQLTQGEAYRFSGLLKAGYGRPSLQQPAFEPLAAEGTHTARLVPVYPETSGLTSKWLRPKIKALLPLAAQITDILPADLRERYRLLPVAEALHQIHFPDDQKLADAARYRFDFEQILQRQLLTLRSRAAWLAGKSALRVPYDAAVTKRFVSSLPWPLTDDQRRSAHEVLKDLDSDQPMMRLLQGDVGSGKTAVVAIAIHQTAKAGFQAAVMAPTETLARQHARTLETFLKPQGVEVVLLVGSHIAAERRAVLRAVADGSAGCVVGTHALIQEDVAWHRLALAVVDEQHRFGVEQRRALGSAATPHLLTMTATPIPRSLALVAFGDQDLSVIRSQPAGRQRIVTEVIQPSDRERAFQLLRKELDASRQGFVVYPVIADSAVGLRGAEAEFARLRRTVFADYRIGLLHGRLPAEEKIRIMEDFVAGTCQVLVTTSVIEVGVDVPNATVMLIEEAQQFGLAQLHQFRGRVGRGEHQSYCLLLPGDPSQEDNERLAAMTTSDSGFDLAEVDLELRGPGDLMGTRQSGFEISLAGLSDPELVRAAHDAAAGLLQADPELRTAPRLQSVLAKGSERPSA